MKKDEIKKAIEDAYWAGFNQSGEGYNSEYPYQNISTGPLSDPFWVEKRDEYVSKIIDKL
jgi:hypothetical protein